MRFPVYSTSSIALLTALALSAPSTAEPSYARLFKAEAGYTPSCNACHSDGGGSPLNGYGESWNDAGHNGAAFAKIAVMDSDTDGTANGKELAAKSNPGDRTSLPGDPGGWLSPLSLIPKPVRSHFAGVTSYKPMETLFTEADFSKAKKMGVSLSADDDNVIYLPLEERKPLGMALIVPLEFDHQRVHLLVATNRKLAVAHVSVVSAPDGLSLAALDRFNGTFAPKVDAPAVISSWDDAVAQAVKKAGAVIFVRLKR